MKRSTTAPAKSGTRQKHRVTFSVRAESGAKVFLAGNFNGWDPAAKEMTDPRGEGVYTAVLLLAPGDYQYKFVIDGTWCADPECPDWTPNEHGTLNSVKHVG
jgi:1,4-alpha-glucan branching enzyme